MLNRQISTIIVNLKDFLNLKSNEQLKIYEKLNNFLKTDIQELYFRNQYLLK